MRLGRFNLLFASDGYFHLDGGGVFGVVPKVFWQDWLVPDDRNRVRLGLVCTLVDTGTHRVLIETGIGRDLSPKSSKIYDVGGSHLVRSLAGLGVGPDDIHIVINTHLHLDHSGWNVSTDDGRLRPTFRKAKYFIQKTEWAEAFDPPPINRSGYHPEKLEPVAAAGLLETVDGEAEILKGIRVLPTGGHTRGHQAVCLESDGEAALQAGDLLPTAFHLKPHYVTAFDHYPNESALLKGSLLDQASKESVRIILGHSMTDPVIKVGRDADGNIIPIPSG